MSERVGRILVANQNSLLPNVKIYDPPSLGGIGAASKVHLKVEDKVAVFEQGLRSPEFDTNVV
jgi:hypothetical protein